MAKKPKKLVLKAQDDVCPEQRCPRRCPPKEGPQAAPSASKRAAQKKLGRPLGLRDVAQFIGCSPWTVRQRLIPAGLPFVRFAASGKLIFYTNQVVAWILKQQGGNAP